MKVNDEDENENSKILNTSVPLILFANPGSGSHLAQQYLNLKKSKIFVSLSSCIADVYIYNLQSEQSRQAGSEKIFELTQTHSNLRVIIAGGDGSLLWLIETLDTENIDLNKIYFGILPFGTGNDLSCMLGWGREPPSNLLEPYIEEWLAATPHNFDFWIIKAEVHEGGGFGKVRKDSKSFTKSLMKDGEHNKLFFSKMMSNYFSIGLDARIGLGFDKRRTSTKCCNKVVYCWEGFKKMCCCVNTSKIPELISSITELNERVVVNNEDNEKALNKDTSVVLALNIRTYGGGDNYVWEKSKSKPGSKWIKQSANDGQIELLNFVGKLSLGLEQVKCTQGRAKKMDQGSGPYQFNFKESNKKCYMQIDGEYFYLIKPKTITLELWDKTREIKVLFKTTD